MSEQGNANGPGPETGGLGGESPPPPPPGGQQGPYAPPPPNWFFQDGQWYNQPYAPDGTCLVREDRTMAMLAHLLLLFTGFIGPLIIYCTKKDDSRFVAFHALQAVYFSIAACIFSLITCGIGGILAMIYAVVVCIRAHEGKWEKYWLVGDWAMRSVPHWRSRR